MHWSELVHMVGKYSVGKYRVGKKLLGKNYKKLGYWQFISLLVFYDYLTRLGSCAILRKLKAFSLWYFGISLKQNDLA
jgi:hypothetical protein